MKTGRMEAFSDGVLAIIITIMVLELPRPEGNDWGFLTKLWPTLMSYILSFIYVGIYWNNHHHMLYVAKNVTGKILWANLHLLFWLSLFPYVTGWAGESHFSPIPMVCYSFIAMMCALAYLILANTIISVKGNDLFSKATAGSTKGNISLVVYIIAMILPFLGQWGAYGSGVLLFGTALMWLVPNPSIERVLIEHEEQK